MNYLFQDVKTVSEIYESIACKWSLPIVIDILYHKVALTCSVFVLHYPLQSITSLSPTHQHHNCHHHLSQADLELNEIDYEREEEELKSLEVPFSILKVEHDQIQEKRRLAEEKRKEEMRVLELKTKAAIFAQAWWRGYSVRKALKNKAKTKKAKKAKKGKDKKK